MNIIERTVKEHLQKNPILINYTTTLSFDGVNIKIVKSWSQIAKESGFKKASAVKPIIENKEKKVLF